jgi:prepilin-type processing-associated H-X9-DG protein
MGSSDSYVNTYSLLNNDVSPAQTVLLCEVQGDFANLTYQTNEDTSCTANGAGWPSTDNGGNPYLYLYRTTSAGVLDSVKGIPECPINGVPALYATGNIGGYTLHTIVMPDTGAIHSGGSNYLAADGHDKWLPPGQVSGGAPATTSAAAQTSTAAYTPYAHAAGTGSMELSSGSRVQLTFSPL